MLEGWGISEAKWHHLEFIMAVMGLESCLVSVGWVDSNLVIASPQINFGKNDSAI